MCSHTESAAVRHSMHSSALSASVPMSSTALELLGGDEVDQTCGQKTPSVLAWMSKQGMGTNTDLVYEYFVTAVDAMTLTLGFSPIRWEEVCLEPLWAALSSFCHSDLLCSVSVRCGSTLALTSTSAPSSTRGSARTLSSMRPRRATG